MIVLFSFHSMHGNSRWNNVHSKILFKPEPEYKQSRNLTITFKVSASSSNQDYDQNIEPLQTGNAHHVCPSFFLT